MKDNIFRVGVLQKRSFGRDRDANTALIIEEIKNAAAGEADILLIPECFITGYELPITKEEALDEMSEHFQKICAAAKQYHIGVVATALTKGKERAQNSAFLIDRDGKVLMKYSKVHTCDFADECCLESGDAFHVCEFDGVKIGIMICYDREYPESARVLMMKGAELILIPNDCGTMAPRLNALSTRAYENMTGVVMANPPGENAGNSCAFSPICWENDLSVDNTILLADDKSSELYFADFDMEKIRNYRNREMMGNTFRKVKAYAELLNAEVKEPFIRERGAEASF